MASRSFRCTKTPKENPMKSERYKGVSGESRRGTLRACATFAFVRVVGSVRLLSWFCL